MSEASYFGRRTDRSGRAVTRLAGVAAAEARLAAVVLATADAAVFRAGWRVVLVFAGGIFFANEPPTGRTWPPKGVARGGAYAV